MPSRTSIRNKIPLATQVSFICHYWSQLNRYYNGKTHIHVFGGQARDTSTSSVSNNDAPKGV
jgi:hypothetical protein